VDAPVIRPWPACYDADATVAAFAARLKDEVDPDSIRDDLAGAVHTALEPAHVSVWMSQSGARQLASDARLRNAEARPKVSPTGLPASWAW
jgi:hypothetical protein